MTHCQVSCRIWGCTSSRTNVGIWRITLLSHWRLPNLRTHLVQVPEHQQAPLKFLYTYSVEAPNCSKISSKPTGKFLNCVNFLFALYWKKGLKKKTWEKAIKFTVTFCNVEKPTVTILIKKEPHGCFCTWYFIVKIHILWNTEIVEKWKRNNLRKPLSSY